MKTTLKPGTKRDMDHNESACLRIFNASFSRQSTAFYFTGPATWIAYFGSADSMWSSATAGSLGNEAISRFRRENRC